jgi:hypothetical protein
MPPEIETLKENDEEIEIVVEGEQQDAAPEPEGSGDDDDEDRKGDAGYFRKIRENETPEETNERRRKEREEKKRRQETKKRAVELENIALKKQMAEMHERVARVETRNVSADYARIDVAINNAGAELQHAQKAMADAVAVGDGQSMVAAQARAYEAQKAIEELSAFKEQAVRQSQSPRAPATDPVMRSHAEAWMAENPWYSPQGGDEESMIMLAIDKKLTEEGRYDPRTKAYWDELTRRGSKRIPDRFSNSYDDDDAPPARRPPRSPISGSGRESGGVPGKVTISISPERKRALQELGVWDDPKQRDEYIREYQRYDRENKRA